MCIGSVLLCGDFDGAFYFEFGVAFFGVVYATPPVFPVYKFVLQNLLFFGRMCGLLCFALFADTMHRGMATIFAVPNTYGACVAAGVMRALSGKEWAMPTSRERWRTKAWACEREEMREELGCWKEETS